MGRITHGTERQSSKKKRDGQPFGMPSFYPDISDIARPLGRFRQVPHCLFISFPMPNGLQPAREGRMLEQRFRCN